MKKYRLKGWVVLSIYLLSLGAIISSLFLLGKSLKNVVINDEALSYVYRGIFDNIKPVVNYETDRIIKPYTDENIKIIKDYYNKDDESNNQEKSLIYYQNTYMPNTGILYGSDSNFDIISVLDGTVADIVADEIMGNIVTIKHSNNLTTVYQCLNEVHVIIGDLLKQGDVIGTSGINKIESSSENMLLFEVIHNGEYINPNTFYNMNINDL